MADPTPSTPDTTRDTTPDPAPVARLAMVSIDCPDAAACAAFWSQVLGWPQTYADEHAAMLQGPEVALGFGSDPSYRPPGWPDHGAKQFHFDLAVADIPAAERRCVQLGATIPADQPGKGRWRVLLDPAGHPFCLTDEQNWG